MSGGLYGRNKAPERTCLPVHQWPSEDQLRWTTACAPGDILEGNAGRRSTHRWISNRKAEKGYGRWLTFIAIYEPETLNSLPEERITHDRVIRYVTDLRRLGNSSGTLLGRLQELGEFATAIAPTGDWAFLKKISSRIRATHKPARSTEPRQLSHEVLALGFDLMKNLPADPLMAAIRYRDGLTIAMLAMLPLRRKNLSELTIGETLQRAGSAWKITFSSEQMKTGVPFILDVPQLLTPYLERYLETFRKVLVDRTGRWHQPAQQALWVSKDGSRMTPMALYDRIRTCTRLAFEKPLNPHLFRHMAATTLSIEAPSAVRSAAALLGHRKLSTTERYYIQANGLESGRRFEAVINIIQKECS